MRQLTSLDAQFLALENSRQTGHVGSLAMLDPSTAPGATLRLRRGAEPAGGARPAAPAAALAARRGAVRARLPVLGRGGRDGPRLPRPRDGAGVARDRPAARRPGGADHVAPARPCAAAVGAVRDRGPRVRARRGPDQDPPLGDRRPVRGGDHGAAARPHARGARGPAARTTSSPTRRRAACRCSGSACSASRRYPVRMLRSLPKAVPNLQDTPFGVLPGMGTLSRRWRAWRAATPAAPEPRRPEDEVQRAGLAAPAVRVRPALARRLQGGQERPRRDGQRRRRLGLRGRRPALAARRTTTCPTRRSSRRCRCRCAPTRSSGPTATGSC